MKFLTIIMVVISISAQETNLYSVKYSPRNANYYMDIELYPETKLLQGMAKIKWTNISKNSTNELWFHLYLNAFAHKKSTFVVESGGQLRGTRMKDEGLGHEKINTLKVNSVDYTDRIRFVSPDDGNPYDSTVVMITLDQTIQSGESIEIDIDFTSKLPKVFARTGYVDNETTKEYFLVAQWFPKIAVLEDKGWNCHQFHGNTEFFADFGEYKVNITLPSRFVLGATGLRINELEQDGKKTYTYHANDVHDFAWTAYPKFLEANDEHNGVALRLLYNEDQSEDDVKAQFQSVKFALDYYQEHYGKYVHPNLTMVNAPEGGGGSDGMEYPTFITCGYSKQAPPGTPFRSEFVTIHEFGHQIFQGILASNEFEHSWMDEGLNSYGDAGTVDYKYGYAINWYFLKLKTYDLYRLSVIPSPNNESMMTISYLQDPSNYGTNSYPRTSLLLRSLENHVGRDEFTQAMRHYYESWKFKHPYPSDFFGSINEKTKEDLTWFFNQYFYENKRVDYEVEKISSISFKRSDFVKLPRYEVLLLEEDTNKIYLNKIFIKNHGDGYFPMDLKVSLKNGETILNKLKWNYSANYDIVAFYSSFEIQSAELDPERKALIDFNYTNNSKSKESNDPSLKFASRWAFWLQSILQLFVSF